MKYPAISVLIPTYNYAHFLDEAIGSVFDQTYTNFELIIVDNHSTDNTEEVVGKYLNDPRVAYYRNEKNIGMIGNFNRCLEFAKGTYIKFLLADDKFEPRLLEKFVAAMEQYPTVSLVTCYRNTFSYSGSPLILRVLPLQGFHKGKEIAQHILNTHGWLGEPSSVMFKKENLKAGNFNDKYHWLGDCEMWLKQLALGDCYIIPEGLIDIRKHTSQATTGVMKSYTNYFEEYDLCRDIQLHNTYHLDLSGVDMNNVVKRKAAICAKALFKTIPSLFKKESRDVFKKAFKIAASQQVIFSTLLDFLTKSPKKRFVNKDSLIA